ncbi:MAG: hypothetical protein KGJ87_07850 [Planctomycetota bacterium]|nr:hypothetical protein [Planctomycetota bacterium]
MNITFDTNCLVDLELNEGAADELCRIIAAHDTGKLAISVPGIAASERLKDGTFAKNFSLFQQRINSLAKRRFEILKPPLYLGLAYLDWAIIGGDATIELERQIHEILFPKIQFRWGDHAAAHRLDPNQAAEKRDKEWLKWRNRKCDTLALWCHIHYGKDVFVTRDNNFHKATKKAALEKLGAKRISQPTEVV